MSINQQITSAPPAPQRSDPNTFADKADAFVAWLESLDDELNQWADECNSTATQVNQDANTAYTSANLAKAYRDEAAAASDATVYDENTTYNYPDTVIGSDGQVYRCLGNDVLGDDPVTSTTGNWVLAIPTSPDGVTTTSISAGQSYQLDNNFLQIISAEGNDCKVILPDAITQIAGKLTYIIRCNGNYKIFLYNKDKSDIVSVLYPGKVYLITPKNTTTNAGYWESAELDAASFVAIVGEFKYIFNSATTTYISATTLSNDNVLIAYTDSGNSNYGTFCIYNKDGNQVVAPTVFNSATTGYISATTLSNDNVLIAYQDAGNSNYGTFCIYNKDGNQVVAPTVFNSATTTYISATTLSNDNVLIAYRDNGNSGYGTFRFIYKGQQ